MISAIAGPNSPKAPRIIAGNVKTFQPSNITHIQKNHEIPRARVKNFQGFAFEILVLILFSSFIHLHLKEGFFHITICGYAKCCRHLSGRSDSLVIRPERSEGEERSDEAFRPPTFYFSMIHTISCLKDFKGS